MKKTTITIVVEHYQNHELIEAVEEVSKRVSDGYTMAHYFGSNELEVQFKIEEEEA